MSNGYGVDFYGVAFYGYNQPIDYSVEPFNAYQTDYNKISLNWSAPNTTPWKGLQLVRSIYGFPSTPADGISLLNITPQLMVTSYDDPNLASGTIYYYTMFLSLEAPTWVSGTTYSAAQIVLYNGQYWQSISSGNTGNTPAVGSAFWNNVQYTPTWYPAGYAATLTVTSYSYGSNLYNRVPQPYKTLTSDIFANTVVDNPALQHYLNVFGFVLDMTKTEYDLYLHGNNPDVISATNLDILGQQFGFKTDYLSSPQARRQRVKNAAINYRLKGTTQGIHNAIASITGWDSTSTIGNNLFLNLDQSSFYHPTYNTWDPATTYFPNALVQFNGYNYKNSVQSYGTAQQPTGTNTSNTWWNVQISSTSSQLVDTTTLLNPSNTPVGGALAFSTWKNRQFFGYVASTSRGVITGLPNPSNSSIFNWNALGISSVAGGGTVGVIASGVPGSSVWSNSANYVRGNIVTFNGPDGFNRKWFALKPSGPASGYGVIAPGTQDSFWAPYVGNKYDDNGSINLLGIPLTYPTTWNASTTYQIGQQVQFFGIIYQAINVNTNSQPSGYYYSNANWIYLQPAENIYTASMYMARMATSGTVTGEVNIEYQSDTTGGVSNVNIAEQNVQYNAFLARFDGDYADLNGINDNTLANLNRPWTASPATPKLWHSTYGMAAVDLTKFSNNTYTLLLVNDGRANVNINLTLVTDYIDNIHFGHGIVFRYQDANNFWYATRKNLYLVQGGVETVKFTYPRLKDGDRLNVNAQGSSISVGVNTRDGTGNINVFGGDSGGALSTATIHGIMQKYSPTGAV